MIKKERIDSLREASGKVTYSDPLTSFLYQLIRDELPAGTVEKIVQDVIDETDQEVIFTNGWLAQYANNLAELLRNAHTIKLEKALKKAFSDEEESIKASKMVTAAMEKLRNSNGNIEDFTDEELTALENKVVSACKRADELGKDNAPTEAWTSFEEAVQMIEHLKAEGQITQEDAERLNQELKEVEVEIKAEELQSDDEDEVIELTDEVIEEIKPSCCGKCKEVVAGTCEPEKEVKIETPTCSDKWQNTQAMMDEIDRELDSLVTKKEE